MSKANDRAKEYAEKFILTVNHQGDVEEAYIDGYHQAEEDLKLTWEDIREIIDISFEEATGLQRKPNIYKEQYYQEVLEQFNEKRKKQL